MTRQTSDRLNTSGFPAGLKDKMATWGQSVTPEWSVSRLVAVLCQDWADDIAGFERKHQIRRKGEQAIDNEEAQRQAKAAELRRQLAEIEGEL